MPLSSGSRLGPYEIQGLLGQGGMGEVYLARDSRLPRDVAIKRVKVAEGRGSEGRERLVREATILSQLTHPRICTLYELFEDDGQVYLAMEALQGESLATRLARNRDRGLPVAMILTTAAEVADGLAFAHERGFIHRDVKPANIMLTSAGAKILDFGIARLGDPGGQPGQAATVTADGLARAGTLPYMAPEQLDGHADARSDLFSLGAVLYEMLTGRRAFDGASTAATVGHIVDERRPTLPSGLWPPGLVRLVDRCLAVDPHARWQTATDSADDLRSIAKGLDGATDAATNPAHPPGLSSRWIAAALAALAIAGFAGWSLGTATPRVGEPLAAPMRVDLALPADLRLVSDSPPAVSPDGRFLAFTASHEGSRRVYLRDLETSDLRPLSGTENGMVPFWSPDGNSVAFFADRQLKRVPRSGGTPLVVAPAGSVPVGGDWSRDDVIVYTPRVPGRRALASVGRRWRTPGRCASES